MTAEYAAPPIGDDAREMFEAIHGGADNIALMSVLLDGKPTTAIVAIVQDGTGYNVHPLYVAVTDDLMDRLGAPDDGRMPA